MKTIHQFIPSEFSILSATSRKTAEDLPVNERARMVVKVCMLCELIWNYTDTVRDIASQMKIQQTKAVSRAVRELHREYEQFLSPILHANSIAHARGLSELFESINTKTFNRLCEGLRVEMGRTLSLEKKSEYLILAVQMVMTVIDAIRLFDADCCAWMESQGVENHTVVPSHIRRLAILIPQYAGDCYDPHSKARKITARILYNDIKAIELYDEKGLV